MGVVNEWAGGINDLAFLPRQNRPGPIRGPVCGNHEGMGFHLIGIALKIDPSSSKSLEDAGIVDQIAEDGQGLLGGGLGGELDGVPDPETHSQVSG